MKRTIAILIALSLFIAILSVFSLKADTESISTLKERCSSLYDGQGRITSECRGLIVQAIKNGSKPNHLTADQNGRVEWR